jgi:hypothetical protein
LLCLQVILHAFDARFVTDSWFKFVEPVLRHLSNQYPGISSSCFKLCLKYFVLIIRCEIKWRNKALLATTW